MPRDPQLSQTGDLLCRHYRAIGPAAIMAALLCRPRERGKSGAKSV